MPDGYKYKYEQSHLILLCPNGDRIRCDNFREAVQEAYEHRKGKEE